MTHTQLVARAIRWLNGSRRCEPVFAGNASCGEIPDAVGWTSVGADDGCIVVECKASRGDFYRDNDKYFHYVSTGKEWPSYSESIKYTRKKACELGYLRQEPVPRMGDFRYYMCEPGIITKELLGDRAPDHGLLYVQGRIVKVVVGAPRREKPCRNTEVRYLRFAIINGKKSLMPPEEADAQPLVGEFT